MFVELNDNVLKSHQMSLANQAMQWLHRPSLASSSSKKLIISDRSEGWMGWILKRSQESPEMQSPRGREVRPSVWRLRAHRPSLCAGAQAEGSCHKCDCRSLLLSQPRGRRPLLTDHCGQAVSLAYNEWPQSMGLFGLEPSP